MDATGISTNSVRLVDGCTVRGFIVDRPLLLVGICSDVTEDSLREEVCEDRILACCQPPTIQMKIDFDC